GRREFTHGRIFYHGDVADPGLWDQVFTDYPEVTLVVHCAARISVPESLTDPLGYYRTNVAGLMSTLESLERHRRRRIVFSSSASIYAPDDDLTVDESSVIAPTSPYART